MKQPAVLLIEDNHVTRKLFRVTLQGAGYVVLEAPDAQSALSLTEVQKPDLILLDLILPDMNGFALIRQLRALPQGADIPILASSGFLSRVDEELLWSAGFTDLLIKPVEATTLLATIQAYLPPSLTELPRKLGEGKRVLLVDDNAAQRKLARLLLRQLGYEITTANNGAEALLLAQKSIPDVVVSDVLMPEMDGFSLCSALRREPRLASVPIILVTSQYIDEADRQLGLQVGANAFVDRTPGLEGIIEALTLVLQQKTGQPAVPWEHPKTEHTHRVARQLERQVSLNTSLTQRCAMQGAALMLLSTISEALTRRQDTQSAMDEVLAFCMDAGGISRGILYLKQQENGFLTRAYGGYQGQHSQIGDFFGQPELLNRLLQGGVPVALPSASFPKEHFQALLSRAGVQSVLVAPILARGESLGALLFASEEEDLDQPEWLLFARTVAGQIGQAMALTEAFQRLTSGEEKFRTLVASINDFVITMDREQRCTGFYGRSHYGSFPLEDYLGKTPREILGEDARIHEEANQRALQGENVVYEWSCDAQGATCYIQNSLAPMRSASGGISGLVCVSRNITEQKNTQTQLLVSERMASIGMLAAGIAHEINNPLAAVIANLDFMARTISQIEREAEDLDTLPPGAPLPFHPGLLLDQLKDSLHDAQEGAERVRQIVRDLKLLSRPDEEQRGPVDVKRVIESSLRIAWNEIRHRARLIKEYGELRPVEANEARLGQVFLNLIVNAAQAIPAGQAEKNVIRIKTYANEEGQSVIEIKDTGPGIPPKLLNQIFNPFFTTKPIGTGTGLGLAICQRIINNLGGKIRVESEENKGTTFFVILPAVSPEKKAGPIAEAAPSVKRGRILVIDDEPLIGTVLKRTLQDAHDIIHTTEGQDALERIASGERFDLILCDLMMPTLTGMELYEGLSQSAPEQAARMVFITGGTFTPQAGAFLEKFSDRILEKPFGSKDMEELLGRWLR